MVLSTTRPNGLSSTLRTRSPAAGPTARPASAPGLARLPAPWQGQSHRQREGGSAAAPLRNGDVATHRARQLLHRRQSKPGTAEARGDADIGLRERPEQALDLGEREPDPAVGNRKRNADLALCGRAIGSTASATPPCSVNFTALSIRFSSAARRRTGSPTTSAGSFSEISTARLQALRRRPAGQRIAGAARQRPQIEEILPHAGRGVAAPRRIDEQRRKTGEMFGARLDGIDPAPLALAEIGGRQQIADGKNSGQRRADLVRERGERRLDMPGAAVTAARLRGLPRGKTGSAFFRRPPFRRPRDAL